MAFQLALHGLFMIRVLKYMEASATNGWRHNVVLLMDNG